MPELSTEERQTVQLFIESTPSVVNIANIGALQYLMCCQLSGSCASLLVHKDAFQHDSGCNRKILQKALRLHLT